MKILKNLLLSLVFLLSFSAFGKDIQDFNFDWRFHLGKAEGAHHSLYDDSQWAPIRLPHDWSVGLPYTQEQTASSTGFKAGGLGWYRKTFQLNKNDLNKTIWMEFDGIYNNAKIWINGHFAAERPYGYSSFKVDINKYMKEGINIVAVQVNRNAYADSRWYTGSGIYRSVRLIKANPTHIPHWGIQIRTPQVSTKSAEIVINTQIQHKENLNKKLYIDIKIIDQNDNVIEKSSKRVNIKSKNNTVNRVSISYPNLWSPKAPNLYTAEVTLRDRRKVYDTNIVSFGIRSIKFDADKGFLLNGKQTKIKGVNLHHDAGAVGTAVPKETWRYRLEKLRSIGVNAIRLAHNPHSPELLDLCDEMGFLTIAEAFDDWERAKDKSKVFLSDNNAKGSIATSYSTHFTQWSERDIKDLIRRDINHPSIILWSIGNEIEWTYPYYQQALIYKEKNPDGYKDTPVYDSLQIKNKFNKERGKKLDNLSITAKQLAQYVKDIDTSRPVTAGLVTPSVGFISGYTDALDVVGFNYRAVEYDIAHKTYPDTPIYGSENWGSWSEWQAALTRDFIPGIFIWTGFAYKGEAGPWPRKGLEISLFDYSGNKTPRGHQFESFWLDTPKVYLATIPADKSEYQLHPSKGWIFKARQYKEPKMQWLRPWEWYQVEEKWHYKDNQNIIVHVYSNTEESELFLNNKSLGKQKISDENDRILFWNVPYQAGELKVVGYNNNNIAASYQLNTYSTVASIKLSSTKATLKNDYYDVSHIHVRLLDKDGYTVVTPNQKIHFTVEGPAKLLAVDNGWENSVEPELANAINTHNGKALAIIQSSNKSGNIKITARLENGPHASIVIHSGSK